MWLLSLGNYGGCIMQLEYVVKLFVHKFVCIPKSKPLHFVHGIFGFSSSCTALVLLYQRYGVYTTIAKVPVYPVSSRPLSEK